MKLEGGGKPAEDFTDTISGIADKKATQEHAAASVKKTHQIFKRHTERTWESSGPPRLEGHRKLFPTVKRPNTPC